LFSAGWTCGASEYRQSSLNEVAESTLAGNFNSQSKKPAAVAAGLQEEGKL